MQAEKGRKLKQIKTENKPVLFKHIAFDVETDRYNHNNFEFGSIYTGNEHLMFFDKIEMRDKLFDFSDARVYSTNLMFDFFALFDKSELENFNILMLNSKILKIELKRDKKFLRFYDSLNIIPLGVENLGKVIGIKKLDFSKVGVSLNSLSKMERENYFDYNRRDSEITYKAIDLFKHYIHDKYNSNLKLTLASTSLDIYRRKYMPYDFMTPFSNISMEQFKAYYGGRVEVFRYGKANKIHCFDVNSLYPFVMQNKFPNPNTLFIPKEFTLQNIYDYEGTGYFELSCKKMDIPYLPFRKSINKNEYRLIFPYGKIKGYYTFYEIRKALEYGYALEKFDNFICYSESDYLFKDYVNSLYAERLKFQKEKNPLEYVIKILLNSLYGKFGLRYFDKGLYSYNDKPLPENSKDESMLVWDNSQNDYVFQKIIPSMQIPNYSNPILSIYVTAYSRNVLYEYLNKYKQNLIYCDTDSVFLDENLIKTGDKLGDMKLEYSGLSGIFLFPKVYWIKTDKNEIKMKTKGVPKAYLSELWTNLEHDIEYKVKTEKIIKLNESFRRGLPVNDVVNMDKGFTTFYKKREHPKINPFLSCIKTEPLLND